MPLPARGSPFHSLGSMPMHVLEIGAVFITAIAVGAVGGIVFGFSLASHPDIMAGRRPNTSSRFLRWICRPTREFGFAEGVLFVLLMLTWIVVFVALLAVPVLLAAKVDGDNSPLVVIAMATAVGVSFFARSIGRRLWQRLVHAA